MEEKSCFTCIHHSVCRIVADIDKAIRYNQRVLETTAGYELAQTLAENCKEWRLIEKDGAR